VIFLWVVTARLCEMGVSMSSRIRRAFLLSTSALASLNCLSGTGSAQTSVTLPTVEVVAEKNPAKNPAVAQPAPAPAQPASETPEAAAARQLAEKAKTFDALRSNLFTTIGTTSYAISHDDIQSAASGRQPAGRESAAGGARGLARFRGERPAPCPQRSRQRAIPDQWRHAARRCHRLWEYFGNQPARPRCTIYRTLLPPAARAGP
jgi:hypothetical protein